MVTSCRLTWAAPDDGLCYGWIEAGWEWHGCTNTDEDHTGRCVCACGDTRRHTHKRRTKSDATADR